MRHFYQVKADYPGTIVFYRMGEFYEMFGDDAILASKHLEISLTTRNKNQQNKIPMCGVPVHSYESYLNKLSLKGFKVAICEQVEDPSLSKGLVKREVTRVVTPGTIISSNLLNNRENHYICCLYPDKKNSLLGVAFCDFSTGEFEVDEILNDVNLSKLTEIIHLYQPVEVLLPDFSIEKSSPTHQEFSEKINKILFTLNSPPHIELLKTYYFDYTNSKKALQNHFSIHNLAGFGIESFTVGICAAGAGLNYLMETQKNPLSHFKSIKRIHKNDVMFLDDTTTKNLELFDSFDKQSSKFSLVWHIDHTKTSMGARLLRKWLKTPLTNRSIIENRLDLVSSMTKEFTLLKNIRLDLTKIGDLERIITRISLPTSLIQDFIYLRQSLKPLKYLKEYFSQFKDPKLIDKTVSFDPLEDLHLFLENHFLDEPTKKINDGGYIRSGIDPELDELRNLMQNDKQIIANIEAEQRRKTGISSLKVRFNRVFGYYIEVSNASRHLVPQNYIRKQTLVNNERFITEELKELEEKILTAQEKAIKLEMDIFQKIKARLYNEIGRIQSTSALIAEMDSLGCFAYLAKMNNYCRPEFYPEDQSQQIFIDEGRHPVIETLQLSEPFIPNDCELSAENQFIMIITGPNMGGKSTYMRQTALIALMAQIGCFVPAKKAKLSIFDRIFTRVGASDNLTRGQSTFMVEMSEAASILNNATSKSLIILDEIGRGTSTFDGISLAWSIIEFLHRIKPLTLFATHYHELVLLEDKHPGIRNVKVVVHEENENIVFLRKVIAGQADKSYGIQVARLAGLPTEVISRAREILQELEVAEKQFGSYEAIKSGQWSETRPLKENEQISFLPPLEPWLDELKSFDLNNKTPLQALEFLNNIQIELKKLN